VATTPTVRLLASTSLDLRQSRDVIAAIEAAASLTSAAIVDPGSIQSGGSRQLDATNRPIVVGQQPGIEP
jgi:hypothetical protein